MRGHKFSVSFHADGVRRQHGKVELLTPGGSVESYQTIREAAIAEAAEEHGLQINDPWNIHHFKTFSPKQGLTFYYVTYEVQDLSQFGRIPSASRWEVQRDPNYIPKLGITSTAVGVGSDKPIHLISIDEIAAHQDKINKYLYYQIKSFF